MLGEIQARLGQRFFLLIAVSPRRSNLAFDRHDRLLLGGDLGLGRSQTCLGPDQTLLRFGSGLFQARQLAFHSLAAGKASKHMEPFMITIQPGAGAASDLSTHEGEEFIYVLEGTVEVRLGLGTVDEGVYAGGKWIPGRRLNGDETPEWKALRFRADNYGIQRVKLYRYR